MRIADLAFVSLVAVERAVDVDRQHGIALPDKATLLLLTGFQAPNRERGRAFYLAQRRAGFIGSLSSSHRLFIQLMLEGGAQSSIKT
jgi:hypothetical protein